MKPHHLTVALLALATHTIAQTAPKSEDPRLEVSLFAKSPDIVHPIGAVFDKRGRLLVIESHTHFPPANYKGLKHDRIRVFEDANEDGKADRITTFHEGTSKTMDLAVHPDGSIYIAPRNEIIRLRDTDGDGKADEETRIVFMDTKGDYPHNGISGLSFRASGDLVFGMGENLGAAYTMIGSDGTKISDQGEGGNIFHCTADGKKLRRYATGFWNPFGTCIDNEGRIFATENDPDSSPPCRLLHIIENGDYGYQYRYGRSGLHVFQSWDGQLPGTLPMVTGTGEAPCEIISYDAKGNVALPNEYRGRLLVASWGEHRIESYTLKPRGSSFSAKREPLIVGDKLFRPVGLAVAPDGALFVTDWVLKDYKLHGKGAIWRISLKKEYANPVKVTAPSQIAKTAAESKREDLATVTSLTRVLASLDSDDAFLRHAGIERLAAEPRFIVGVKGIGNLTARQRHGIVLAQQRHGLKKSIELAPKWLKDADPTVRLLAAKWIADRQLNQFADLVRDALLQSDLTPELLEAYLSTLARLSGGNPGHRKIRDQLRDLAIDNKTPTRVRTLALRRLPPQYNGLNIKHLRKLVREKNVAIQTEAVRSLAIHRDKSRMDVLKQIIADDTLHSDVRAWAIIAVAGNAQQLANELIDHATGDDGMLAMESLRALVGVELSLAQKRELKPLINEPPDVAAAAKRVLKQPFAVDRPAPTETDAWISITKGPANATMGRRVFHSKIGGCINCHTMEGRGAKVGPDLTRIGQSANRKMILESILQPSKLIAPRFYPTKVVTHEGETRIGIFAHREKGEEIYVDATGNTFRYTHRDIAERTPTKMSLMPDNLLKMLTDQEIRDLLAFLMGKR